MVILIVSVRPNSVCLRLFVHFIEDSMVAIWWEKAVLLAFCPCCFYFMPSQLCVFISRLVSGAGIEFDCIGS